MQDRTAPLRSEGKSLPFHGAGRVGRTRIWGRANPRALHDSAITTEFSVS